MAKLGRTKHDKLILLVVVLAGIMLIGTWTYYDKKSKRIEEEMSRMNKNI